MTTLNTPQASSHKPQATHPGATSSVATGQVPQATDGSATEHGCSPAGSRIDAPPAAVRGPSDTSTVRLCARETARAEFHRAADAALDALTNLHATINRHRSRLTVNEVATVKQQLQLIHHTIRLWGLLGSVGVPPASADTASCGTGVSPVDHRTSSLPQEGWAGR